MSSPFIRALLGLGILLPLAGAFGLSGCVIEEPIPQPECDECKPLVPPSSEALEAAARFVGENPGARVFFSQNSGEILWVDGGADALARASGTSSSAGFEAVMGFIEGNPDLYGVAQPRSRFRVAESLLGDEAGRLRDPETGIVTLRIEQLDHDFPIQGNHLLAFFSSGGDLLGLVSRVDRDAPPEASSGGVGTTSQALTAQRPRPPGTRRLWRGPTRARGTLVDERVERRGVRTIRVLTDATDGRVLERLEEMPSELISPPLGWELTGFPVRSDAPDSDDVPRSILSTQAGGALILGFRIEGISAPGAATTIGDAGSTDDPSSIPLDPLATDEAAWADEAAYGAGLTDATRLAENLETTLRWFKDHHGYSSWDGEGAEFHAAIRGDRTPLDGETDTNAYGSNGYMLIGDGRTASGQPVSDALDVVAHEFTHSVISAHADFAYRDESGALNESLADVIGVSVEGFTTTVFGDDAGWGIRDLLNPTSKGQPKRYGMYRLVDGDNGGVHINSGIMNRALTMVILGPEGTGGGVGPVEGGGFLLRGLRYVAFDPLTSLEEYAAAEGAHCLALQRRGALTGSLSGLCPLLEASFDATELLSPPLE